MYDVGGWRVGGMMCEDERLKRLKGLEEFCVDKFIINVGRVFYNLGEVESQ